MKLKHTPGPWAYANIGEKENCWIIGIAERKNGNKLEGNMQSELEQDEDCEIYLSCICEIDKQVDEGNPVYNARLIAAAPKMLERIITAIKYIESTYPLAEGKVVNQYLISCVEEATGLNIEEVSDGITDSNNV